MKAISIRQPWSWRIINNGKDIENRNWPTKFRGPVLLHAAKGVDPLDREEVREENMPLGGIVGWCEITDCVTESDSPWFFGKYGFVLDNVRPLPFIPCKGALGFFTPDIRDTVIDMHINAELSEGQACCILSMGRVDFRKIVDEFNLTQ